MEVVNKINEGQKYNQHIFTNNPEFSGSFYSYYKNK